MKNNIYLDHAATTYVDERVLAKMKPYFSDKYGNPGSMHDLGLCSRNAVKEARSRIAALINCRPDEITFTASGTESINLAIKGLASRKKGHIITTKTEHKAVLETCKYLERNGCRVSYLDVDKYGAVDPGQVEREVCDDTILITIIYGNNEIGTVNNIKEISLIAREKNVPLHTDACQAGCYLDLDVDRLGVDMMTLNSSKIYGPKGMGLLYIRKDIILDPIIHGGGQERGRRSGTENVSGIVGFAEALRIAEELKQQEAERLNGLREKLTAEILRRIPKTIVNGHPTERLPNNASFTFLDVEGESILLHLNELGIYASTGSACTSRSLSASHVLSAIGQSDNVSHGSIRFSLGRDTTEEDINKVVEELPRIVEALRKISPLNLTLEEA